MDAQFISFALCCYRAKTLIECTPCDQERYASFTLCVICLAVDAQMGCKVGLQGVTAVFRFQRGAMRLTLPVLLSTSVDPLTVLIGCIIPAAVDTAVRLL